MVESVTKDGKKTDLPSQDTKQAVSREAADTTTSMLQSVVDGGTGTAAQGAGRPAAGKTGTAEQDKAAWFAGYTPDLATVVAVMGADPDTAAQQPLYGALGLPRMNGGGPPAEIWAQYTKAALQGSEAKDFDLELQDGANVPVEPPTPNPFQPSRPAATRARRSGQDQGRDQGQTQGQNQGTTGGRDQGQTQGQTQGQQPGHDTATDTKASTGPDQGPTQAPRPRRHDGKGTTRARPGGATDGHQTDRRAPRRRRDRGDGTTTDRPPTGPADGRSPKAGPAQ